MSDSTTSVWKFERLRAALSSRWLLWVLAALAALLVSPSIDGGWVTDDHVHRIMTRDDITYAPFENGALDLYRFADPANNEALLDDGVFPWWADPEIKLAFFRPLSSVTTLLDHRLFPESPAIHHLHSIAWFVAFLLVCGLLYRKVSAAPWIAGLAMLLLALDDAQGPAVGWIANRYVFIAGIGIVATLLLHIRWRSDGVGWARFAAPAVFAISLFAGESALAATAYLFAYALWLDPGSRKSRALSLLPYAAVVVAWRVLYGALGYGAEGSAAYVDPASNPLEFIALAAQRIPILLNAQFFTPWSDFWDMYSPGVARVVLITSVIGLCMALLAAWPVFKERAEARFWLTGAVVSCVPVAATMPADRLLVVIGIGAFGFVAHVLDAYFLSAPGSSGDQRPESKVQRLGVLGLCLALLFTHVIAAPALKLLRAETMETVDDALARCDDTMPSDAGLVDRDLILVNPPLDAFIAFVNIQRISLGVPIADHTRWLGNATRDLTLTRTGPNTLDATQAGGFMPTVAETLLRERAFAVGDQVVLTGFVVDIHAITDDGRPAAVTYTFAEPLESDRYSWIVWDRFGYVDFVPPAIGETIELEAANLIEATLGVEQ